MPVNTASRIRAAQDRVWVQPLFVDHRNRAAAQCSRRDRRRCSVRGETRAQVRERQQANHSSGIRVRRFCRSLSPAQNPHQPVRRRHKALDAQLARQRVDPHQLLEQLPRLGQRCPDHDHVNTALLQPCFPPRLPASTIVSYVAWSAMPSTLTSGLSARTPIERCLAASRSAYVVISEEKSCQQVDGCLDTRRRRLVFGHCTIAVRAGSASACAAGCGRGSGGESGGGGRRRIRRGDGVTRNHLERVRSGKPAACIFLEKVTKSGGLDRFHLSCAPECARRAHARLDLVDDHKHAVLLGDVSQALEEGGRGVVVTALGLDGLDDERGHGTVCRAGLGRVDDGLLDSRQRRLFGVGILAGILREGVLDVGPRDDGPVERGNVELVDRLGAGGGERAEETAVEGAGEAEDGQVGAAGRLVLHAALHLFGRELGLLAPLARTVGHKGSLEGVLVGAAAAHGGEDLVEPLGTHGAQTGLDELLPVGRGKTSRGRRADRDGGDLCKHVEEHVSVGIGDPVALRLGIVDHKAVRAILLKRADALADLLGFGSRNGRRDEVRCRRLTREERRGDGSERSPGSRCRRATQLRCASKSPCGRGGTRSHDACLGLQAGQPYRSASRQDELKAVSRSPEQGRLSNVAIPIGATSTRCRGVQGSLKASNEKGAFDQRHKMPPLSSPRLVKNRPGRSELQHESKGLSRGTFFGLLTGLSFGVGLDPGALDEARSIIGFRPAGSTSQVPFRAGSRHLDAKVWTDAPIVSIRSGSPAAVNVLRCNTFCASATSCITKWASRVLCSNVQHRSEQTEWRCNATRNRQHTSAGDDNMKVRFSDSLHGDPGIGQIRPQSRRNRITFLATVLGAADDATAAWAAHPHTSFVSPGAPSRVGRRHIGRFSCMRLNFDGGDLALQHAVDSVDAPRCPTAAALLVPTPDSTRSHHAFMNAFMGTSAAAIWLHRRRPLIYQSNTPRPHWRADTRSLPSVSKCPRLASDRLPLGQDWILPNARRNNG
ncbi:hypothetical protein L1887_61159 [Cichorium endivia]|nr:hypothetical protein L1887_61159 [Cichorium endivia]